MARIYATLIEFGIIILIIIIIGTINDIKLKIKFRKQEKEWIENSFEFEGGRYHKDYFKVVDGKIVHNL